MNIIHGYFRWVILLLVAAITASIIFIQIGNPKVKAETILYGPGSNIDSVAFWSNRSTNDTLLFVSSKDSHLVEIWHFPFSGSEQPPLLFDEGEIINGVAVDERTDRLFITGAVKQTGTYQVYVFSLPGLQPLYQFGKNILGEGETNLGILHLPDSETRIFVTDDHTVYIFRVGEMDATLVGQFQPPVSALETVMADDYTQLVYVPEERGNSGLAPGIHVYDANGKPYMRDGSNVFGSHDQFQSDAEGIALYRCYDGNIMDTGRGFIVVSDQNVTDLTDFEIFDRATWRYLGNFNIEKVINTDGVAVLETALPGYPDGIFSAVHDDQGTAILGWREIFGALDISCESADSNPQDHR